MLSSPSSSRQTAAPLGLLAVGFALHFDISWLAKIFADDLVKQNDSQISFLHIDKYMLRKIIQSSTILVYTFKK